LGKSFRTFNETDIYSLSKDVQWNGNSWVNYPDILLTQVSCDSDEVVWGLDTHGQLYRKGKNSSKFVQLEAREYLSYLTAGRLSEVYSIDCNNNLLKWTGASMKKNWRTNAKCFCKSFWISIWYKSR